MSALEQTPLPNQAPDRRISPRLRLTAAIPVFIGRGEGVLVDLSTHGARIRHTVPAKRNSNVRVSFEWNSARFIGTAEVLSSHVVALGNGSQATQYETRLRFRLLAQDASEVLARVLACVENDDVRRWVANLRGWSSESTRPANAYSSGYLRCRLVRGRWETKWTFDAAQPSDGFCVAYGIDAREMTELCETYQQLDEDGRHMIRQMAAATLTN